MSEDLPRYGDTVTLQETETLMRLYAELVDLASEARQVLASEAPGTALQRLRKIDARVRAKVESIATVLR